jgi:PAS domain S-box-containing protein
MIAPPDQSSEPTSQQVNDLFDSDELSRAVETEEFRHFLDRIPIAIVISKLIRGDQRVVYANKAFETLTGQACKDLVGRGWSILADYKKENDLQVTLQQAMLQQGSEEFLGTFQRDQPRSIIVEAYSGLIQNEDGTENYRIAALIDVTTRARAEREEMARQLRDKDFLLKELQHRVKNNLQLITALIRLDSRSQRGGDKVNLDKLAGRVESLQLLYRDLSMDGWGQAVDLGHYLSQIASAVVHTYAVDGIRLDLKVDYAPVSINIAMPVGLLVNELLTNAFKYAFAGGGAGTLTLRCLHEPGNHYRIVVADDGIGLPEGNTWPLPGKLGALIVQTLKENVKTDVTVESAPGKGTRVTFGFVYSPIPPRAN